MTVPSVSAGAGHAATPAAGAAASWRPAALVWRRGSSRRHGATLWPRHEQGHRRNVVLGEQALYTNFGGPEVMKGQLDRLLAVMRLPRLSLGIIPRSAPVGI
ncbi:Scr1 family TA system antitoxin-like transcriptional regulator [Streptomyces sp. NPDC005322]|uniref:Scr1 family TA system antitoxin-like transcriptional regulator n=1 Tax=unclassified Streptomyces TaxID=2593676 RepID=UPI0033A27A23